MEKKSSFLVVGTDDQQFTAYKPLITDENDVVFAKTDSEAKSILARKNIKAILLDLETSEIDIFSLLKTIVELSLNKAVPVIVVSSCNDKDFRRKVIESGAEGILSKPLQQTDLLQKIEELTGHPKVILAVDDLPLQLRTYNSYLVPRFDLRTVTSAKEAIAFLLKNKADVILLDIDMPGFNGFDFLANINNIIKGMNTPIVIVSGRNDEDFIVQVNTTQAVGTLTKPVTHDGLILAIKKAFALNVKP